jgi:hypothetical protein
MPTGGNQKKSIISGEQSPYAYYLGLLGEWTTGIALASQWFLYFDFTSVNALMSNLQDVLRDREKNSEWTYNKGATATLLDAKLQYHSQSLFGCAFAREVKLPREEISAGNEGLEYGGFQAPATSNNRSKYGRLSITMIETNASFIDLILRPWTIAVGYNGLVARSRNSKKYVKSNYLDVVMLAKTGAYSPMGIRKIYRFYNVAPVSIPQETYSYAEEGLRVSDVEFVFDSYAVMDGGTGAFINLNAPSGSLFGFL